jgi:hypothetical protein
MIDSQSIVLGAGSNLFAMGRVLTPQESNTISPLDKGINPVNLSIVDEKLYKDKFKEDMDETVKSLGGYPGYIAVYKKGLFLNLYKLSSSFLLT